MRALLVNGLFSVLIATFLPASLHAFELSWTDQFGETTYTLSGPDLVCPGDTAEVTATATDLLYPGSWVASSWSITDNGVTLGSGFALTLDDSGFWSSTYLLSYDEVGTHQIIFTAQDLGHGSGGHGWEWFELAGIIDVSGTSAVELASWGNVSWGNVKALFR